MFRPGMESFDTCSNICSVSFEKAAWTLNSVWTVPSASCDNDCRWCIFRPLLLLLRRSDLDMLHRSNALGTLVLSTRHISPTWLFPRVSQHTLRRWPLLLSEYTWLPKLLKEL